MLMKRFIMCFASIAIILACGTEKKEIVTNSQDVESNTNSQNTEIDHVFKVTNDSSSVLKWTGSALLGKMHFGTVNFTGSLGVKDGNLVSGDLVFDMQTINTQDLNGKGKEKLDKHLMDEDFFFVEKFPNANLKIKGFNGKNLIGDLTIKEVTKEISFPAILEITQNTIIGKADFTINRTEYGIVHGSNNFFKLAEDRIISDDIEFNVSIKATK